MMTMPRILITGKDGQVGHELLRALAPLGELIATDRRELDLTWDDARIEQALDQHGPDIIVNPAAYTAVDKAESDEATAHAVNACAVGVIARWTARHGALLVHYSTDYVFSGDGERPWREDDATGPQSVYGRSKLAGEEAIRHAAPRHLILRTSWVFGAHGANFLKTMLKLGQERDALKVVNDQIGAPASAAMIADVSAELIRRYLAAPSGFAFGTYHLAPRGETSWHGYASYLLQRAASYGLPLKIDPANIQGIPSSDYPLPAKRPANSRLSCDKLKSAFGIELPEWRSGVDQVLAQLLPTYDSGAPARE
ncbi:dTDP-4-dehydrorhamnose reductase [Chromobacterium violaceum]|uniref:dTDP-4-dehydrorhamnose reductase n=1 Tax=Chromobacterium violaceum TaxID=536 RepID=UPI0009D94969|nr:dTDP-4-dehydrorhamnose reductase [Chromobacterium violaceum]MBX9268117.1 dTDP-4-dehydrorhamnose reductase [Chromobacterium violaceum]OQS46731.1 dTDP-4-dehydrorhamnose reductase [Chromobacterium violaceum]OQS49377.1 dTDP-4-dehydrorhamnose reductase [Chromobacterium violaceum]QRO31278.1 dTDP-4-dehydrorhamnose reductase [Chromobacterium violaceum]QRQ18921.1 dTDP-4-dehydrorhamnose reductase [Chromobacterium violaceum]